MKKTIYHFFAIVAPFLALAAIAYIFCSCLQALSHCFIEPKTTYSCINRAFSNTSNVNIAGYSFVWLLLAIAVLIAIYLVAGRLSSKLKTRIWRGINSYIWIPFVVVWILGFVTYYIGTHIPITGNKVSLWDALSIAPMAIIRATLMFLGQSDISAIRQGPLNNALYMFLFNLSHLLAVLCSLIFVLHQFGFYIIGEIKTYFASLFYNNTGAGPKNLYIFWGLNERSMILAKSIDEHIRNNPDKRSDKIIFVRTFDGTDSHSFKMGFERLFSMVKLKNKEISDLQQLDCLTITSFQQLSRMNPSNASCNTDILRGNLRLAALARLIKATSKRNRKLEEQDKGKVHFFLLNNEEDMNLNCARHIVYDTTLKAVAEKGTPVDIYFHARENDISRAEENMHTAKNMEIRILDSSRLAVNLLKNKSVQYHPVSFVDVETENPATVVKPFNTLLIGFGETGRDTFKFLYEYSAFLDSSSNENHTQRSPFNCHIVDKNMDLILPRFLSSIPMFKSWTHDETDNSYTLENQKVTFHSADFDSEKYFNKILTPEYLDELNYVVISLGDDDCGISVAVQLLRQISRQRKRLDSLKRFKIFLRVFSGQRYEELCHVKEHYNSLYGVEGNEEIIVLFGNPYEMFTYDVIVKNKLREEAKEFYQKYNDTLHEQNPLLASGTWENRRNKLLGFEQLAFVKMPEGELLEAIKQSTSTGTPVPSTIKIPLDVVSFVDKPQETLRLKNLKKLLRQESQDMANAQHKLTKWKLEDEVRRQAPAEVDEEKLTLNLSITEHLRWKAAHEMLGYTPNDGTSCNEIAMTHNCLVPWEDLEKVEKREGYPYDDEIPFSEEVIENNPECKNFNGPIKIHVNYHPNYKLYDKIVVETSRRLRND